MADEPCPVESARASFDSPPRADHAETRLPRWSIEIPDAFAETFLTEGGGYWHAYDAHRSVSLSSIILTERGRPVPADAIVSETRKAARGKEPVLNLPTGHVGWACRGRAEPGARASRQLSGGIAIDGVILLATITADDEVWARATWLSIRSHPRGH